MTSAVSPPRARRYDVAIVGLGPAGRALASRCIAQGLSVLAIDPRPGAGWTPTYGIWAEQLGSLPENVVRSRVHRPELWARGRHLLPREYAVLDNAALQQALPLSGAEIRAMRLDDKQVTALRGEARVVIDARGARPQGSTRPEDPRSDVAPAQTAYGIVVPANEAAPALDGAEGLLMDWRTDHTGTSEPSAGAPNYDEPSAIRAKPTFLYGIPLGGEEVLLEETCLAAAPGLPIGMLRARLRRRLLSRGVPSSVIDDPIRREVVRIPMRGRARPAPGGVISVGTGGRGGNVVTGYSVAHSLVTADRLATQLANGADPTRIDSPAPSDLLREAGLRALLRLRVDGTLDLFDAFGQLSVGRQRAFWSREASTFDMASAMWGMFTRMPPRSKVELARATLGP